MSGDYMSVINCRVINCRVIKCLYTPVATQQQIWSWAGNVCTMV